MTRASILRYGTDEQVAAILDFAADLIGATRLPPWPPPRMHPLASVLSASACTFLNICRSM
jgi:hypothetical protein